MKNNKKINYWIGRLMNDVRRVSTGRKCQQNVVVAY